MVVKHKYNGLKREIRDTNQSLPSSVEVMIGCSSTSSI